jgi:hypothetical protein
MTGNVRKRSRIALALILTATGLLALPVQAIAQANRCTDEAASLRRAETQLPRIDVARPDVQQIVCITLETNIVFARRFAAHLASCPRSPTPEAPTPGSGPARNTLRSSTSGVESRRSAAIADRLPQASKTREEPGDSCPGLFSVQLSNPSAERRAA